MDADAQAIELASLPTDRHMKELPCAAQEQCMYLAELLCLGRVCIVVPVVGKGFHIQAATADPRYVRRNS